MEFFVGNGKLSHAQFDQIRLLSSRVKLSLALDLEAQHNILIDFRSLLAPSDNQRKCIGDDVYLNLSRLATTFVTTNYDDWLDQMPPGVLTPSETSSSAQQLPEVSRRRFCKHSEITLENLDFPHAVFHIHGSFHDRDSMVLTMVHYLERYASHRIDGTTDRENPLLTFLQKLFQLKNVLFIGYGLSELEVLEYVLQKGIEKRTVTTESVCIPYWYALDYLEAVAKRAGETNSILLAGKVMSVVRDVSEARDPDGTVRDNYRTYRRFAEILGLVPTATVRQADLDLIPGWIQGKFDRGMVCHALDTGVMRRLLASESPDDWTKAITILRHCTAVMWVEEQALGESRQKPITVVEDHWLKQLIKNHAQELGKRVGRMAAEIFVERLHETYDRAKRDLPSWLHRPAIENHAQNHEWMGPENRFVEGLRDALMSWVDHDVSSAKPFVQALIRDDVAILPRIGIHVVDRRWDKLKQVFFQALGARLLDDESFHEVYGLLKRHFESFTDVEKKTLVDTIKQLGEPSEDEEENRRLRHMQRKWLSALAGKGYEPADNWFNDLNSDQSIGLLSEHLDFHSYIDFEDRLKSILTKVAASGRRGEALVLADRLKQIPGMIQIFLDLQGGHD